MTFRETVAWAGQQLAEAGSPESVLEAEVLVMHITGTSRAQLYASYSDPFPPDAETPFIDAVHRRLRHEPLAYIVGSREFFGLEFQVDPRAMIPRQETETLVEQAIEIAQRHLADQTCHIADIGTGCAAIAVSLATALPNAHIDAVDLSSGALKLAAFNCRRHGVAERIDLLQGDLLGPIATPLDMVVANLPYIPEREWDRLQPDIRLFEPPQALVSGTQGLGHILRLLGQAKRLNPQPQWLLLEMDPGQVPAVKREVSNLFPNAETTAFKDLYGLDRGVIVGGLGGSSRQETTLNAAAARLRD